MRTNINIYNMMASCTFYNIHIVRARVNFSTVPSQPYSAKAVALINHYQPATGHASQQKQPMHSWGNVQKGRHSR